MLLQIYPWTKLFQQGIADGADIMIDDIRVYGSATDPTVIQTTTEQETIEKKMQEGLLRAWHGAIPVLQEITI